MALRKAEDTSRHDKIQDDWNNREYIELIVSSMRKIACFLNEFDNSCRSRIASLNQKMAALERKLDYVEGRMEVGKTNSSSDLKSG